MSQLTQGETYTETTTHLKKPRRCDGSDGSCVGEARVYVAHTASAACVHLARVVGNSGGGMSCTAQRSSGRLV